MDAIWVNANVRISITPYSVILTINSCFFFHKKYLGDMVVSAKTAHKLMTKENGSNSTVWNAYADSTAYLWDQNIINEYIIAYELNSGLDYTLQDMLPKVHFDL